MEEGFFSFLLSLLPWVHLDAKITMRKTERVLLTDFILDWHRAYRSDCFVARVGNKMNNMAFIVFKIFSCIFQKKIDSIFML